MSQPIKDYALLGNLRCAALVGRNGSIDWFCPPRFDAPACFSKLLGTDKHGFWQIAPEQQATNVHRHYEPDTLVLRTEFECNGAQVRLTDYMPVSDNTIIVRCVEGLQGSMPMNMQLSPRFGYGAQPAQCEARDDGCNLWAQDRQRLILHSDLPLQLELDQAAACFEISAGQVVHFILQYVQPDEAPVPFDEPQRLLTDCRYWWRDWLLRLMEQHGDIRVLYDINGDDSPEESELDWLPGHLESRPVRIGNAARDQHQLDVYGQLIDLLHIGRRSGMRTSQQTWYRQCRLMDKVIACWQQPDEGIWELRGRRRHYIHSKVYAWVACDRSIRDAEEFGLHAPLQHWRKVRDEIHAQVCAQGVDPIRGAFKQSYEDAEPDASLLMIPLLGFLPVEDPRVQATIRWVSQQLQRDGLVYRIRPHQSEAGWEGSFITCSFWMVDSLIMSKCQHDAESLFARLLALRNDVGLLAEQFHPQYGLLGNFPQALSHLALVKSAYLLQACEKVHHGGRPERHSYRPVE